MLILPGPTPQSGLFQVNVDEPATAEACVLVGMLVLLRVATYFALRRKTAFGK